MEEAFQGNLLSAHHIPFGSNTPRLKRDIQGNQQRVPPRSSRQERVFQPWADTGTR